MQRAFLVGILLALIIPCVGIVIVLKRLSMIGDALVCTPSSRQRNNLHFTHENPSCIPYG
ncbi:metal ABC transporter permease, partial [Flavonifractor plautii]|uniref:metal ABC transporter permease n=1 Tax=Flavonifractor plautii TaxID=292800 RepID=UPI003B50A360